MKFLLPLMFLIPYATGAQDFTFNWRQIAGPVKTAIVTPDSSSTLVTGLDVPGEYLFEFSVSNLFGTGRDTCKVTVLPATVLSLDTTKKVIIERPVVRKFSVQTLVKGDLIYVQAKSPKPQEVKVVLFNVMGQALAEANIPVKGGENIFTLPKPRQPGVYIIRFYNNIIQETHKLII